MMQCVLCRVENDGSTSLVSEHEDLSSGIAAGWHSTELEDFDFSYSLYTEDGIEVAKFKEGRICYREWARRNGRPGVIHALDEKYDHDEDRLMRR